MDKVTAIKLASATSSFYRQVAGSFARTRAHPWSGWNRCVEALGISEGASGTIVDLGCGNLRFERYMAERFGDLKLSFICVDNCEELVTEAEGLSEFPIEFVKDDLISAWIEGHELSAALGDREAAHMVAFGLMHHIPGFENRIRALRSMASICRPGGSIALSFWCFDGTEERTEKARAKTEELSGVANIAPADLDEGDYLLGWQERTDVCRYCHSFSEAEVDRCIEALRGICVPIARFDDEGDRFNRYLVMRVL